MAIRPFLEVRGEALNQGISHLQLGTDDPRQLSGTCNPDIVVFRLATDTPEYSLLFLTFNALHDLGPEYLKNQLLTHIQTQELRSQCEVLLILQSKKLVWWVRGWGFA